MIRAFAACTSRKTRLFSAAPTEGARRCLSAAVVAAVLVASTACGRAAREAPSPARLFSSTCARCHGESGGGGSPAGPDAPAPRNFRDLDFQRSRTDRQIRTTIASGKAPWMPAFENAFDDRQLDDLVRAVRSFASEGKRNNE
jgi:mono/diheme cytochrome c family protein